jgi:hypothetical protein
MYTPPRTLVVVGVYGDVYDVLSKVIRFLRRGGGKDTICKLTARRVLKNGCETKSDLVQDYVGGFPPAVFPI